MWYLYLFTPPNGNVLTVTDARGNTTSYTYDSMDRVATRTDPVGASESFGYDRNGNLTQHTDRKGQGATFRYDGLDRPVGARYADGSSTSFSYDAAGRLMQATDSMGGTVEHEYDGLDRLIAQTQPLGTVRYQYDALGRRTQMQAPGVAPVVYGYDPASRLTAITQAPLAPVALAYDGAGRRTRLTLPNQVSTEYQYDPASRLTALIYRNAAGVLGDLSYEYDGAGNRSQVTGSFARTLLPAAVASASYDAANRQRQFGETTLSFDANGNTTSLVGPSRATALTWDARDQLVGVEAPGTQATFAYGFGRRLAKMVNMATTQYLYVGLDITQAFDAQDTTSYLRSLAIDETLGLARRDGTFFSLHDPLGSTITVTDGAGTSVTEYSYEPFGTTDSTNPTVENPFQFTGRENDGVAGLYSYRARYYHPLLQRFLSEDPIGFAGGDVNLYAYVFNRPTNLNDPLGLDGTKDECSYVGVGWEDGPPSLGGRKDRGLGLILRVIATKIIPG